jgi:hypothetical protein
MGPKYELAFYGHDIHRAAGISQSVIVTRLRAGLPRNHGRYQARARGLSVLQMSRPAPEPTQIGGYRSLYLWSKASGACCWSITYG